MPTIRDWGLKIKAFADDALAEWGVAAIVLVIALASFGLGRLSAFEDAKPVLSVAQAPVASEPAALYMGALVVASRSGSVYYYPWCAGAQKIAPANQVWFSDDAAAERAGYTPSKSCKGLGN